MLSKWFTLSMVILASLVGGLACIQLFFHKDDLGKIFGTPPRQAGDVLYENFDPGAVHTVVISKSSGERAEFVRRKGIWRMVDPKQDRADYAILQTIIYFSRHLQVEDVMRRKDITLEEAGMRASGTYGGRYNITLKDRTQNTLANYRLGRRTAWHRLNDKDDTLIETFFVRPAKGSMDDHIYICLSLIHI